MPTPASPRSPARVLVTGAFGNIGSHAVRALREAGHAVRALSHTPARDERAFGRLEPALREGIEVVRGDVRDRAAMDAAVRDVDCVVHLAYVIPPPAYERPAEARSTNVEGTRTLLAAMAAAPRPPRLLFASTLDVYGIAAAPPPRRVGDPLQATDEYSGHKIACEQMVAESGLSAVIFRFADVPPIAIRGPHPMMFRLPLAQRIEMIHPADAGLAVARAVASEEVWGKTLNIGGGPRCQLVYRDYLAAFLDAMGIGMLPSAAFSTEPYCTDWLDSEESQRLLGYQRHGFEDVVRQTAALLGWRAPLARALRPVVRWSILRLSPYQSSRR